MHNFKLNLNDLKKPFLTKMLSLQNTHITVADIAETINCRILSFNLTFETSSHFGLCRRRGFGINLFSGRVDIPNILINIRIKKEEKTSSMKNVSFSSRSITCIHTLYMCLQTRSKKVQAIIIVFKRQTNQDG